MREDILLEDGENIVIKSSNEPGAEAVEIKNENGRIIVRKKEITLEKPKYDWDGMKQETKESILRDCSEWIDHFTVAHSTLWDIAKEAAKDGAPVYLEYRISNLYDEGSDPIGKRLAVDLRREGSDQIELSGPVLFIRNEDDKVFKYLFAWTLDYFLYAHFGYQEIEENESSYHFKKIRTGRYDRFDHLPGAEVSLYLLKAFGEDYIDIYKALVHNHNHNLSSNSLLNMLREDITGEKRISGDRLNVSIDFTKRIEEVLKEQYNKRTK